MRADEGMSGFFNTGVSLFAAPNRGAYEYTKRAEDVGKFRAPTLRNIAVTAPYMHDGSLATLEDVIDHYVAGGKSDDANKSHILQPLKLSEGDKTDLVEFLKIADGPGVASGSPVEQSMGQTDHRTANNGTGNIDSLIFLEHDFG